MRIIFETNIDNQDFLELIIGRMELERIQERGLVAEFPSTTSTRILNVFLRVETPYEENIMPLVKGPAAKSKKGFGENIKREMEAGKPQKQAVAIAYSEAKGAKKKKAKVKK